MCLIAYVPAGKALTREVFDHAYQVNGDGIGVMSVDGVQKFFGHKALKKARAYAEGLAGQNKEHAVHWRFATHGSKTLDLCHPFKLPNTDAWLMHNGVIGEFTKGVGLTESDTSLFVKSLTDAPTTWKMGDPLDYWNKVCGYMGHANKGIVMYAGGHFVILNKTDGYERGGIWFSNLYSLPDSIKGIASYYAPQRLRPATEYYDTRTRGYPTTYNGPFGVIYWSEQRSGYGYWEGNNWIRLNVTRGGIELPPPISASNNTTPAPKGGVVVPFKLPEGVTREALLDERYPLTADVNNSIVQNPVPTAPERATREIVYAGEKCCARCGRPEQHGVAYRMKCWCTQEQIAEFKAMQAAKEAERAAALPSGPTLDRSDPQSPDTGTVALAKQHEGMCEHGEDSWENCRECINRLQQDDTATMAQRILLLDGANSD